jgi:hypothetical protein
LLVSHGRRQPGNRGGRQDDPDAKPRDGQRYIDGGFGRQQLLGEDERAVADPLVIPVASARLSTAGAAPGSIIAAIMATHTAMKNVNEPSLVAAPMSIPRICQTVTTQAAAASPRVAASAAVRPAAVVPGVAVVVTA